MAKRTNRTKADRIRAAYRLLGLEPGTATQRDARRAYRQKAQTVHPDHRPDSEKERANAEMAALTEALDLVLEHIKSGGRLDEADAVGPVPRTGSRFTIHEVQAPAGTGKTTQWAAAMSRQPRAPQGLTRRDTFQWPPTFPRHMVYAAPTIDLLKEVAAALAKVGVEATLIHSGNAKGLVNQALARYFNRTASGDDAVLLITHAALMDMPHRLIMPAKKGQPERVVFDRSQWDLVIDEAPEIITFYPEAWPLTHRVISERVISLDWSDKLYQLLPKSEAAEIFFRMLAGDIPHDTNIGDGTREVAKALTTPSRLVLVNKAQWDDLEYRDAAGHSLNPYSQMIYGGAVDVLVITTPLAVNQYRSVTVMGARLDTSLYHLIWSRLFNVEWAKHPLQAQLSPVHRNGRRLRLHYMVDEAATREMLTRQAEGGGTMFQAFASRVGDFFNPSVGAKPRNRQFIWSAPLDRGSVYGVKDAFWRDLVPPRTSSRPGKRHFDPDLRLSGKAMGQNKYMKYHNAVLLNVVNFSPNQWLMMRGLGLTDAQIYRAQAHNVAYQDLLRCSIRDTKARDVVNGIVIDRATALDIGGDFPGCILRPMEDAPQRAKAKRRGRKADPNDARTDAEKNRERQRRWAAKQRTAKQRAKEQAAGA